MTSYWNNRWFGPNSYGSLMQNNGACRRTSATPNQQTSNWSLCIFSMICGTSFRELSIKNIQKRHTYSWIGISFLLIVVQDSLIVLESLSCISRRLTVRARQVQKAVKEIFNFKLSLGKQMSVKYFKKMQHE